LNINKQNVSKAEEALVEASQDMIAFGKLFLPDDFLRSETPWFHYEIADSIMDKDAKQLAVIMPRGHGKTVLTKCDILWSFLFTTKEPLFYGWVSATAKLATGNMDYIKHHLEFNDRIKYYFGNLKGRKWTEEDIELSSGHKLLCKSNISGIRGGAKLHKRYDLVILDDFEDENNTITPEARAKNSNLITAVVYPALEPHTGRLRINGTPVHYDSFINNLLTNYEKAQRNKEDFAWTVKTYKALDQKGNSLWTSWFPKKKLEEKKKFYQDSGQPQKFYQEYMMEVQSKDDAIFSMNHVKYWEGHYLYDENTEMGMLISDDKAIPVNVFCGVDPATDSYRRDSDFSVLMVVGVDEDNTIYVIDYIRERGLPVLGIPGEGRDGIVDKMFDIANQYRPQLFVVEDTTMSRPIFQALMSECRRRNNFDVKWREEKPGTRQSKLDRIQGVLTQRMTIGSVKIKKSHYDLQHEIVTFGPRMAHDDTIDALAYSVMYAHPPKNLTVQKDGSYRRNQRKMPKSWVIA
tara:strand:- start:452 stop:2008 length:1557 start_codon:yes stop_codon:yes gene_type:complete